MVDSLSGHTAAGNDLGVDGLRDGDSLASPTLTNILQGLRGNGIIRLQDFAYGSSRNSVGDDQPGSIKRLSTHTFKVFGGYVILDGQLYEFAGGPGGDATLTLGTDNATDGTALNATGEQSIYVVYLTGQGGNAQVHVIGGSPVKISTGLYPSIPSQYLIDYDSASTGLKNEQVVVLATLRCEHSSSGGDHNVNILEVNDKRHFIRNNPIYMFPLSSGNIVTDGTAVSQIERGTDKGVQEPSELKSLFAAPESGDFGTMANGATLIDAGALWMSTGRSGAAEGFGPEHGLDRASKSMKDELFFAAQENAEKFVVSKRLFGKGVSAPASAISSNATYTLTSFGDEILILNPADGVTVTLRPQKSGSNYMFPEGHTIEVSNTAASTGTGSIVFDDQGINSTVAPTYRASFVYEGSTWIRCDYDIFAGGASTWLNLTDTPGSYTASKGIRVNSAGNALEFYTIGTTSFPGIDDQASSLDDQLTITDTAVTINADQDDLDFKVMSDTNAALLHVDGAGTGKVGINQATPEMTFQIEEVGHEYDTATTNSSSTSTPLTIDLFTHTTFRAAKVLVEIENSTDEKYEVAEILVTTTYKSSSGSIGSEVEVPITVYGATQSDSTTTNAGTSQGSYAVYAMTNGNIQLRVTPAFDSKTVTVKAFWHAIAI